MEILNNTIISEAMSEAEKNDIVLKCMANVKNVIAVIKEENEALVEADLKKMSKATEKKVNSIQIMNECLDELSLLMRKAAKLSSEDENVISLKNLMAEMDESTKRNQKLLDIHMSVTADFHEMYKARKKDEAVRKFGYDRLGKPAVKTDDAISLYGDKLQNKI